MEAFVIIFIIWIVISLLARLLSSARREGSSKPMEGFLIRGEGGEEQYKGALADRLREELLAYSETKQVEEEWEVESSVQIPPTPKFSPELERKIEKPSPLSIPIPRRAALPKFNVSTLQQAIIMAEILGPPRARRQLRRR